jgi:hypothetical protein
MSNSELMTTTAPPTSDGITGYTDEVDGQETKKGGLFRGTRIKFSKTSEWEINGEVVPPETRLIMIDVARIVTRWAYDESGKKMPAETIVLDHGERFPDTRAWNEALPRSEWVKGFNGQEGPWKPQQIVYFLDPKSMKQYHWVDWTTGGGIAIREAIGATEEMRKFRPGAAPIVELSTTFMPTRFEGRQRPEFVIHSWVALPSEDQQHAALPAPGRRDPVLILRLSGGAALCGAALFTPCGARHAGRSPRLGNSVGDHLGSRQHAALCRRPIDGDSVRRLCGRRRSGRAVDARRAGAARNRRDGGGPRHILRRA